MENVSIRSANEKDVIVILDLLYELGRPKPQKNSDVEIFEKLVRAYLKDSDKEILVAEHDTDIVGIVSIMFLSRLNRDLIEMYIPELVVTKSYQNQGVGKKLVSACIELAKKKKCHRIRLESGIHRKESHIFYKNLGFEQSALSFSKDLK